MISFSAARRKGRRAMRGAGTEARAVMPLTRSLDALGSRYWADPTTQDVRLDRVVGTVARTEDFDRGFRPLRRGLRERWERVQAATMQGRGLPPVQLVQMGELFFVADGHHRVSVARANGMSELTAQVRKVCTIAYACHCLTVLDLPVKVSERQFLERFPLPDDVRPWLWLDDSAGWSRVQAAAEAWIFQPARVDQYGDGRLSDLVAAWWDEEVVPSAQRCRPHDDPNLDGYLCALKERDADGCCIA